MKLKLRKDSGKQSVAQKLDSDLHDSVYNIRGIADALSSMSEYVAMELDDPYTADTALRKLKGIAYRLERTYSDLALGLPVSDEYGAELMKSLRFDIELKETADARSKDGYDLLSKANMLGRNVDEMLVTIRQLIGMSPGSRTAVATNIGNLAMNIRSYIGRANNAMFNDDEDDWDE